MNMMTKTEAPTAQPGAKLFLDEHGDPSDRSGPDLHLAKPIAEMLANLKHRKTGETGTYSSAFYQEARDSGITLSAYYDRNGEEHLFAFFPLDSQEDLRRPRYDALLAHLKANPRRRRDVIDLMNILGRFVDDRAFSSVDEAADELLAAGGRIYVLADGRCEEHLPGRGSLEDSWNGYKLRRLYMRYDATLRRFGRGAMGELVRRRGVLHEGSGSHVLRLAAGDAQ